MTKAEELAYTRGRKAMARDMLAIAIRELGDETPDYARLLLERADAIAALRTVCDHHGDNEWDAELHLADIINKHLGDHLDK